MSETLNFILSVVKIMIIDLALAGDNALVIALAVRTLPRRQQFLGRVWGAAGAVGLRVIFIAIVTYVMFIPMLQVAGGLILVWIAVKLVRQSDGGGTAAPARQGTTLLEAIWVIIVADVVMSLDNVIGVAGAAEGDLRLVVFGVALSIPIVVWGSGILAALMTRHAWLILVAGGILGEVGGKMIVHDPFLVKHLGEVSEALAWAVRLALAGGIMVIGWLAGQRRADRAATTR